MENFTKRVISIILEIPPGKIMTYGQIAKVAGSPRAARQVVRILHSMSNKYNLPWHRVINSKGEIGLQDEELFFLQKTALEGEGIVFMNHRRLNISDYQYDPAHSFPHNETPF